ncbi:exonuclease [Steroidobacter denitrificans]|uniref:Exonuclease n=1 Tax=Steroidobacter denitrificans TaxID=465721 RepID=A0A127F9M9_STEDE|nr:exonuclease [Steroidobacter denitrificans]AMN46341.1 exonuclease [Steroidobacter denitrificans]
MNEIYISTDVETDGPIPGPHSMLSLGSAAYLADKQRLSTFSVNLQTLPGANAHPRTAAWWATQPEAWAACRKDLEDPATAMKRYVAWIRALPGKAVFVAYPAGFDFLFVYWYLIRFVGESPFGFSALDIKSFAMAMLKKDFRRVSKKTMPARWFDPLAHTHVALDDAIEQGALFCNMLRENRANTAADGLSVPIVTGPGE